MVARRLEAQFVENTATLNWTLFDGESSAVPLSEIDRNADLKGVLDLGIEAIKSGHFSFRTAGGNQQDCFGQIEFTRQADGSVSISLRFPTVWSGNPGLKTTASVVSQQAFGPYVRARVLQHAAPEIANFYTNRESTLLRLEALNARISVENDQNRRALEASLDESRRKLEEDYRRRLEELEGEYKAKNEAVSKRESDLDERKKLLDDRDNTHARREGQKKLLAALEELTSKFSLTPETTRKRWPAGVGFGVLIVFLMCTSGWTLYQTGQPLPKDEAYWYPIARLAVSLAALGSSMIFFIRWQDRWSSAHADEEFRLKRFALDVARADWLVEVILEWNRAGAGLPADLLQRLATGLFEQPTDKSSLTHPAEDILSALSSVSVKAPFAELNIDRKGLKKLSDN